jgi:methanethiol S-methyltransferase
MNTYSGASWTRNLSFRLFFVALAIFPLFFLQTFADHIAYHFGGNLIHGIIEGQWTIVAINIALFLSFLFPLFFRRKIDWREFSLVTAFFVSLFIEMYGIPLSVYFASRFFSPAPAEAPDRPVTFSFLGTGIGMTIPMIYGTFLMIVGTAIIAVGWVTLYRGLKGKEGKKGARLVTGGIYSISRHPHYVGFMLVIIGWLVGWPTLLVVVFAPILIAVYVRVCLREEREMGSVPGYGKYRRTTPFLI